jgi:hypothetical protein
MASDKECRRIVHRRWRDGGCRHPFACELLEARLFLAAVSWDGGGNGTAWEDPLNWSGNTLPVAADDVTINIAANPAIVLSSGVSSIHSLVLAESLTITGGTLSVATTASVSAVVTVNGGSISGGSWDLAGGQIRAGSSTSSTLVGVSVAGEIVLPGGANLRISAGITLSASSVIRLRGRPATASASWDRRRLRPERFPLRTRLRLALSGWWEPGR